MSTPQADSTPDSTLKTAGEIVALQAGVVAAVYILGGLVLAVRLLSDGFAADAVVDLLGQAPRELVISRGMVQAIAPAVLLGIGVGLVYGVRNGPKPRADTENDRLTDRPHRTRTLAGLALLTLLLTLLERSQPNGPTTSAQRRRSPGA